jgi:hypothetical protein
MEELSALEITKTTASILSLIISVLTLMLAFRINRAYSRRQLLNKQIEKVSELIESLHNDYFEINFTSFMGTGSSAEHYNATIFEVSEINKRQRNKQSVFEDNFVLLNKKSNQILNVKKFIDNPFIPKKIADKLLQFYSWNFDGTNNEHLGAQLEYCVVIESKNNEEQDLAFVKKTDRFIHGNAIALRSWLSFVKCSEDLRKTIENWFLENNITDVNIRTDFKKM